MGRVERMRNEMDMANSIRLDNAWCAVKGLTLTAYFGCLLYCIYAYAQWDAGRWTGGELWSRIGCAYVGVTVAILLMAWLNRLGGFTVWSGEVRRGFDVIFRKKDE